MTKENTKDQETKENKVTATSFLVTTDAEKVKGFCRLKEDGAKNKIFESLESTDRYEKRRVTAIQICSIALSNLWHIQSQRGENKGKIADAKTLSGILKEIVEEKVVGDDETSKQKRRSLLASSPTVVKQAQLILMGVCFVGITAKDDERYIEDQPTKVNKDLHSVRVFNMKNDPFPFKDEGANENPTKIDDTAKICTTKKMVDNLYKFHFDGKELNKEKTGFPVGDGTPTHVDYKAYTDAIAQIKTFIRENIYDSSQDFNERLGAYVYDKPTTERHEQGDFSENVHSKEFVAFQKLNVWLNETMVSVSAHEKSYREQEEEKADLEDSQKVA